MDPDDRLAKLVALRTDRLWLSRRPRVFDCALPKVVTYLPTLWIWILETASDQSVRMGLFGVSANQHKFFIRHILCIRRRETHLP